MEPEEVARSLERRFPGKYMITISDQERVEISDGVEEILLHDKDVPRRNHATEILVGQLNVMGLTVDKAVKELKTHMERLGHGLDVRRRLSGKVVLTFKQDKLTLRISLNSRTRKVRKDAREMTETEHVDWAPVRSAQETQDRLDKEEEANAIRRMDVEIKSVRFLFETGEVEWEGRGVCPGMVSITKVLLKDNRHDMVTSVRAWPGDTSHEPNLSRARKSWKVASNWASGPVEKPWSITCKDRRSLAGTVQEHLEGVHTTLQIYKNQPCRECWVATTERWAWTPGGTWIPRGDERTYKYDEKRLYPRIRCRSAPWTHGRVATYARGGDLAGMWDILDSPVMFGNAIPFHVLMLIARMVFFDEDWHGGVQNTLATPEWRALAILSWPEIQDVVCREFWERMRDTMGWSLNWELTFYKVSPNGGHNDYPGMRQRVEQFLSDSRHIRWLEAFVEELDDEGYVLCVKERVVKVQVHRFKSARDWRWMFTSGMNLGI